MENKRTRTIQSIIKEKLERTDRNGNTYYILKIENGETIFAFAKNGDASQWVELVEGKEYQFTVEVGKQDSNVLVSFQ